MQLSLVALECWSVISSLMCFLSPIITHTNILHQLVGKKTTLKSGSVLYSDFSVAKTSEYFLVLILLDLSPAFNKAIHSPLETVYSPGLRLVFFDISALSFVFFSPASSPFLDSSLMQCPRVLSLLFAVQILIRSVDWNTLTILPDLYLRLYFSHGLWVHKYSTLLDISTRISNSSPHLTWWNRSWFPPSKPAPSPCIPHGTIIHSLAQRPKPRTHN